MKKYIDLFITHAWRYHEDWIKVCDVIDYCKEIEFRNFSVPWHDPGIDLHSKIGINFIEKGLKSQIYPVQIVLLLNSVYEIKNAQKWVGLELNHAKNFNIPVLGLPNSVDGKISDYVVRNSDKIISWDNDDLINSLVKFCKHS